MIARGPALRYTACLVLCIVLASAACRPAPAQNPPGGGPGPGEPAPVYAQVEILNMNDPVIQPALPGLQIRWTTDLLKSEVVVTGHATNVGSRPILGLEVRVRLVPASEAGTPVTGEWVAVKDILAAGESASFTAKTATPPPGRYTLEADLVDLPETRAFALVPSPFGDTVLTVDALTELNDGDLTLKVRGPGGAQVSMIPGIDAAQRFLPQWVSANLYIFGHTMLVDITTGQTHLIRAGQNESTLSSSLSGDRRQLALSFNSEAAASHQVWVVNLADMRPELIFEQVDRTPYTGLEKTVRWAPDGDLYFVARADGVPSVYQWRKGAAPSVVYRGAIHPTPSPDGSVLAYQQINEYGHTSGWRIEHLRSGASHANAFSGTLTWVSPDRYVIHFGSDLMVGGLDGPIKTLQVPGPVGLVSSDGGLLSVQYFVIDGRLLKDIRYAEFRID